MEANVPGSQDQPFYDLLHPHKNRNNGPDNFSVVKQMDDDLGGFDKDIVLPSFNSLDSKPSHTRSTPLVHKSIESQESVDIKREQERNHIEESTIAAIERIMKRHCDSLVHALDCISGRLSELEHRTESLETTLGDLKMTVGSNHGETDGRMRMLENLLREVQTGVQILRDKHEIAEARSQLEKSQIVVRDSTNTTHRIADSNQVDASSFTPPNQSSLSHGSQEMPITQHQAVVPNQSSTYVPQQQQQSQHIQSSTVPTMGPQQGHPSVPPMPMDPSYQNVYKSAPTPSTPFAPPPQQLSTPPQTHMAPPPGHPQVHSAIPSVPAEPPYQTSLASSAPPPLSHKPLHYGPPQGQPTPLNKSQVSPYSDHSQPPPSMGYSDGPPVSGNPSFPQQQMQPPAPSNYGPEQAYMPPNYGPPVSRQPQPTPSRLPSSPRMGEQPPYEQQFGRPYPSQAPVHPGYGPGPVYGDSQSYGGPGYRSPQSDIPPAGSSLSRLPSAKPVQHSLPVATNINSSSGSSSTTSKGVPVEEVIDQVGSMGFPRDQVKGVVRRLVENGQNVDLNTVLDKLMNGR